MLLLKEKTGKELAAKLLNSRYQMGRHIFSSTRNMFSALTLMNYHASFGFLCDCKVLRPTGPGDILYVAAFVRYILSKNFHSLSLLVNDFMILSCPINEIA